MKNCTIEVERIKRGGACVRIKFERPGFFGPEPVVDERFLSEITKEELAELKRMAKSAQGDSDEFEAEMHRHGW